jgi:glutaredoxin
MSIAPIEFIVVNHRAPKQLAQLPIVLIMTMVMGSGCAKDDPVDAPVAPLAPSPESAAGIRVHPDEATFLYRYFPTGKRKARTVSAIERVPAENRSTVLVVPGDQEVPPGLVYVADLRKAAADGTYPYQVMEVAALDRVLDDTRGQAPSTIEAPAKGKSAKTAGKEGKVILYSASWCSACTKARRWLTNKGIPFQERDVEKDPGARSDMLQRAKSAGVSPSQLQGVPVIWAKGQIMMGFDPKAVLRALGS